MKVILILGSTSDEGHAQKITVSLDEFGIAWDQHVASAHKQPRKVLEILDSNANEESIVYVTIAGRSNALSGFVAANSEFPTIGCPPFSDKVDMLVNIHIHLANAQQHSCFNHLGSRKLRPCDQEDFREINYRNQSLSLPIASMMASATIWDRLAVLGPGSRVSICNKGP